MTGVKWISSLDVHPKGKKKGGDKKTSVDEA